MARSIKILVFAIVLFSGFSFSVLQAQENIEGRIKAVENEMSRLRQENFDILSPTNFEKAQEELENARKDFQAGKDIKGINEKLEKAGRYLKYVCGSQQKAGERGPQRRPRDDH
ncbi:MAG: hypothetical protein P8184_15655 [Calditrichia bacterium]